MENKKIEDMNIMELKGVLFDLNEQIIKLKNYGEKTIMPLLQSKINEIKKEELKNAN